METKLPLISVIVPIYNVEPYLHQCVDSILTQTYENLEVILIDDGSTDGSPTICDEYAQKDNRVRVIHKENGGLSDARNAGIREATGEWISFIDSDDFIAPEMYQVMIAAGISENAEIVCCGRYIFSDTGKTAEHCFSQTRVFSQKQAVTAFLLSNETDESACDKLLKKDLFADIQFPVGEVNEDLPVIPVLLGKSKVTVHTGKAFYYYRVRKDSISKVPYSSKSSVVIDHMRFISQYIDSDFPELSSENACFQARYAVMMLGKILMLPSKGERERYQSDYLSYKNTLKNSFFRALQNKHFAKKYKIKGVFILLGVYRLITKFRIALRKRRHHDT